MKRPTEDQPTDNALDRYLPALFIATTLVHWVILAAQIPILARLPDWYWRLSTTTLDASWVLLFVAAQAILTVIFVLRHPQKVTLNLLLLIALGLGLQFGFAFAEGRGIDGLRDRIVSILHAEFARVAVQQTGISDVMLNYEQLVQSDQLGGFAKSKPPGQLLLYMFSERLAYTLQPHSSASERLTWFQTSATYLWPVLSYLVLIPIYFLAKTLLNASTAWVAAILYLFVPSVTLMTLHTDQVLFPLFFTLCLLMALVSARDERRMLLILTGVLLYLCLYVTFALVVIVPFLAGFIVHFAWSGKGVDLRRAVRQLVLVLIGGMLVDISMRVLTGYDLIVRYRAAMAHHQDWRGWDNTILDITYFAGLNVIEYATWIGLPLAILAALGIWRALSQFKLPAPRLIVLQCVILAGVICMLALFGRTKAEVARLWLFLVPCVCITAAYELSERFPARSHRLLYLVLVLQAGTIYLIKANQDFW